MEVLSDIFEKRKNDSRWNTSYPLSPDDWKVYRVSGELSFSGEKEMSFYIHIPFCKGLCSFCEYTRMLCPSEELQKQYIATLKHDIWKFIKKYPSIKLCGFDVGGGTPTALNDKPFELLMDLCREVRTALNTSESFMPSIETTFDTLSVSKIETLRSAGFRRVSLGVQSTMENVLLCNHRKSIKVDMMKSTISMLHSKGISIVNLDMMYGLKGQTFESLRQDVFVLKCLQPEQVTLYELRTNMIREEDHMTKDELYNSYSFLYNSLRDLGYYARFGQNTFSKRANDIGKLKKSFNDLLAMKSYDEEYVYQLPPKELASKYIAISAYNGSFSLEKLSELLGCDATTYYSVPLDFCVSRGYIEISNERVIVTPLGFKYYGALFSLFYASW